MTCPRRPRRFLPRPAAVAGLLVGLVASLTASGADTVILKDGFVIQGTIRKEVTSVNDPATGRPFAMVKANGLDLIDEGPKVVVFSTHTKQLGEVNPDIKLRPEYRGFKVTPPGPKSTHPLPAIMSPRDREAAEFGPNWRRTINVDLPGGNFDRIEQQITYLDPYFMYLWSPTHRWRLAYRTSELDPDKVRKLLSTHPELVQEPDKPDAEKRIAVAKFMLDGGWLVDATDDLARIKKEFPGGVPAAAKPAFDSLAKEIDVATAALYIKEGELALAAGRYAYAAQALAAFPDKIAEAKQVARATELMAQLKDSRDRFETGRRLLRTLIDSVTGRDKATPLLAAGGGTGTLAFPARKLAPPLSDLVAAAEEVYAELHPDSAQRIDFFVNLATQVEREVKQGRDPSKRPDELLATAISGWVKGKNGAKTEAGVALRLWAARETVLAFQREEDPNSRLASLAAYQKANPLPIDELAQVISLLPPAEPENLLFRSGTALPAQNGLPEGVYRRKTRSTSLEAGGLSYLVRLPSEYHHGRPYPVVIALTNPGIDARSVLASLAFQANQNGYILLVPEWANQFGKNQNWNWKGEDHEWVTAVLRDAVRHFCVDNDRVFLFGFADGGSMAMDVGASHPDLFAGVLAMGPIPKWVGMFDWYWKNAQKLPFYVVTGELSGQAMSSCRSIYEKWMPYGFPSIMVVYKGRAIEWYSAEVPVMFDWMSRKKRVTGAAVLKLDTSARYAWTTMRATDNRFYWLEADEISERNLEANARGAPVNPAEFQADIAGNNVIRITSRGISKISVWLSQEMIDWTKPVAVNINRVAARGWKARVIEPDIRVLLDDYRERGDRRMLFLQHLTFDAIP